jgi:hypothetical protein
MLNDFIGLLKEYEITYSWFQQDGATATANNSKKLRNEIYGEHVITTNLRPPRSPDLIPPEQQSLQCTVISHARLMM